MITCKIIASVMLLSIQDGTVALPMNDYWLATPGYGDRTEIKVSSFTTVRLSVTLEEFQEAVENCK